MRIMKNSVGVAQNFNKGIVGDNTITGLCT